MPADFQLVKFKGAKITFEVLTKMGAVKKYREGALGFDNVLYADDIFKHPHNKGEKARASDLKATFDTENVQECIKIMIDKGELQLTSGDRKDMVDKRRKEIVNYLHKYFVDPKTKRPHPVTRLENALEEMKYRVDADTPVERQVLDVMKKLPEVLPMKKEEVEGTLSVPHKYMGQCGGIISKWCKVGKENYTAEGCDMQITLTPGDYDALLADLQRITKGDFNFDIVGAEAFHATTEEGGNKKKKKKGKGRK